MKYKLTEETKVHLGRTLHRIECVTAFGNVKARDKGGWVESEKNLSQKGTCWVFDDAEVSGNAKVFDDAEVSGNAKVFGNAEVSGNAKVYGYAKVSSDSDYMVIKNTWSSGRYFTYTKSNNMWKVGCFYGTGEQLIKKAYADSELKGKCYEIIVRMREDLDKLEKE